MLLGEVIERLSNEDDAGAALEALNDVVLFTEIDAMSKNFDESPPQYVAASAARFAAMASDEDWLGLMNTIERAGDPAQAVLVRMVKWGLARDAADLQPAPAKKSCGGNCGCGG